MGGMMDPVASPRNADFESPGPNDRCPTNPPCAKTVSTEWPTAWRRGASSTRGARRRAARGRTGAVAVSFPPRAFLLRPIHGVRTERVGVTEPVSARGRGSQRNRVRDGTRWSSVESRRDWSGGGGGGALLVFLRDVGREIHSGTRAEASSVSGSRGTTGFLRVPPGCPAMAPPAPATASSAIRGSRPCTTIRGS
jgi:hypothetical protein